MGMALYRLGRWSIAQRRRVVALWVVALAVVGVAAASLGGETSDNFELPGTEAQTALDRLNEEMPAAAGATARVVFEAPSGTALADPANDQAIGETVAALRGAPEVVNVTDPFESRAVSPDGTIGYANVSYAVAAPELTEEAKDGLQAAVDPARAAGLTVEFGGDALREPPHAGSAEIIGIGVAVVVLLITFGSLIAAGLPILTAVLGVSIGMLSITALTSVVDMSSTAPTLAVMLGLAVGIDYALFIVTRHRQLRAEGLPTEEAAARAVGTAGSAVVFAGATVIIALVGLVVVGIPFLTVMGLAAAGTVAVSVLIAVTLLPALLGFAGDAIDRYRVPGVRVHTGLASGRDALGLRWARFLVRRAAPVLVVSLVAIGVIATPALNLELGLPDDGSESTETSARRAFDLLAEGFGPGFNGPLLVTVDADGSGNAGTAVEEMTAGVAGLDNVVAAVPAGVNADGSFGIVTVIPGTGPSDPDTATLVDDIRASAAAGADDGVTASVTGAAALNIDITKKLGSALPVYALVVVGLALVLLTIVFRSILVPVTAALGFLLSVAGSFGATVAVFQWGWLQDVFGVDQPGPIISILPILLLGILFGLAMDYEVFLVSRIREDYVHKGDACQGVVEGVRHSARVIVAAGLIMIAVFAAFILSGDVNVKMIGFTLAVGVMIDAFIVRMTIMPAVLALLGDSAWKLPRALDRVLPNVDIEGESITAEAAAATDPSDPADPAGSELVDAGR
ncbi:MAG: MMPL family transporter [Acidimicrobiales bacterium]